MKSSDCEKESKLALFETQIKLMRKLVLSFEMQSKSELRRQICSLLDEDSELELATEHFVKVKRRDIKAITRQRISETWIASPV